MTDKDKKKKKDDKTKNKRKISKEALEEFQELLDNINQWKDRLDIGEFPDD